jgi:hypothetical protein
MIVMIPEDKRKAMVEVLSTTWGEHRRSFTLIEAARLLLGTLISLCRVCHWGIFLFTNLYQAMYEMLGNNAHHLMSSPEYRELVHQHDEGAAYPTDNARFCFFSCLKSSSSYLELQSTDIHRNECERGIAVFTAHIQRSDYLQFVSSHCHRS